MTAFVHVDCPTEHPGVVRAQNAAAAIKHVAAVADTARGASTMLLAAVVSALLVVANQVIDTWGEGHLLAAWMVLWLVAFAALALLTSPVRRAAVALRAWGKQWAESRRQAAEDEQTWQVAQKDARMLADLYRAMDRSVKSYY